MPATASVVVAVVAAAVAVVFEVTSGKVPEPPGVAVAVQRITVQQKRFEVG